MYQRVDDEITIYLRAKTKRIVLSDEKDIDRKIVYNTQCELDVINIFSVNKMTQNLEDIKVKLSSKYQNFLDVFDRAQADKLSSHHSYDHKIELTSDVTSSHCQAY